MNIIIAGDGKVGKSLTKKLSNEGHNLTLIDEKQDVIETAVEQYDVMAIQGNCASMPVLKEAGVEHADLLIAATGADEINLLCCMTAHGMNQNLHTIARIRNPEYTEQIYKMRNTFALSMTVNPEKQAALEIERILKYPGFLHRDTFAKGRVEIVELRVDPKSKMDQLALNDFSSVMKCKVLVCAVRREGKVTIPDGNFILQEGDRIWVTAPTSELTQLLRSLGLISDKAKRVLICGGGRISFYLAQQISRTGIDVLIIEQDRERCQELSGFLPNATIIHGDASNQSLLETEGISECDAVITLTGLDEMNMIISLYAKKCGVKHTITKVGHLENYNIQDSLSIGSVICPKEWCCSNIVRYVRAMQNKMGAANAVHAIADGDAEALEFRVDEQTKNCGIPLKKLKLKKNVLLACISNGNVTEFPTGDSYFKTGDLVIVMTSGVQVIHSLDDIFE